MYMYVCATWCRWLWLNSETRWSYQESYETDTVFQEYYCKWFFACHTQQNLKSTVKIWNTNPANSGRKKVQLYLPKRWNPIFVEFIVGQASRARRCLARSEQLGFPFIHQESGLAGSPGSNRIRAGKLVSFCPRRSNVAADEYRARPAAVTCCSTLSRCLPCRPCARPVGAHVPACAPLIFQCRRCFLSSVKLSRNYSTFLRISFLHYH